HMVTDHATRRLIRNLETNLSSGQSTSKAPQHVDLSQCQFHRILGCSHGHRMLRRTSLRKGSLLSCGASEKQETYPESLPACSQMQARDWSSDSIPPRQPFIPLELIASHSSAKYQHPHLQVSRANNAPTIATP